MFIRVYGVDKFKYATRIFKWVAMVAKFGENKPKLHKIKLFAKNRLIFRLYSKVYGVGEFKYATWIFEGAEEVAVAIKIRQK